MAKLLIVEDDKYLASAYRVKLTKAGFEVQNAYDGEEALQVMTTYTPDLILLDIVMPKKDGFATLEEIRQNPSWKNIPVIITSNLGQKEDIDKGMNLGATDFIVKSDLSLNDLITKINGFVNK